MQTPRSLQLCLQHLAFEVNTVQHEAVPVLKHPPLSLHFPQAVAVPPYKVLSGPWARLQFPQQ